MPLTPADVHNVAFSKPPIGKRGYNEDEVDAFLDLVEAELARLIEENDDLREQVSQLEQRLGNAQADLEEARVASARPPWRRAAAATQQMQRPARATTDAAAADGAATRDGWAGPKPDYRGDLGGDHHVQAAKVLGLAQEMADRLTAEAKSEADSMLADARNKSEQLLVGRPRQVGRPGQRRALACRDDAQRRPHPRRDPGAAVPRQGRPARRRRRAQADRDHRQHHPRQVGAGEEDRPAADLRARVPHTAQDLPGVSAARPGRAWDRGAGRQPGPRANGGYAATGYGQRADAGS